MPVRGVPRWGFKLVQPPGSLCASPLWSWKRVTKPTPVAPCATCLYPKIPKLPAPCNWPLPTGRGTEAVLTGGWGGAVGGSDNNHPLYDPPCPRLLFQVPRESSINIGKWMDSGGAQPLEGATEVGMTGQGVGKIGRGWADLRKDLRGGGPGNLAVWVGDVGDEIAH